MQIVSIFRFLKDTEFNQDKTIERLIDTIQWRIENRVARMTYRSIAPEFFEEPFAFFYKEDLIGRPIAVIQMRYFPKFKDKTKTLADYMQPFACLVMEMARQITRDLTRKNENDQVTDKPVLVSQIAIIIDITKAPFVPIDSNLIQMLLNINNSRFPGFVGSVYVMNFGWMYQGIWQVVKLVLSEQAKARVSFTTAEEMKQIIGQDNLLRALGGNSDYNWSLESDAMLDLYATEKRFVIDSPLSPSSPIMLSTRTSRSSSVSSIESGIFFDAPQYLSRRQSSNFDAIRSTYTSACPSVYGTPGSLTPINAYQNRQQITVRAPSEPRYFLNGFHMGDTFLTSFFRATSNPTNPTLDGNDLTERLNQLISEEAHDDFILDDSMLLIKSSAPHFPHMLPNNHPHSLHVTSPLKLQLVRAEQKMMRWTRKLFHFSFAYKGAVYWVLLYCFLRGPVEHNLKKALTKFMTGSTQQIAYTTVGITATVAAVLSTSFSSSLQNNNNNKRIRR
ncbi:CRAL-TRIO domain-containing protein [Mucor mucedo]|uniref:CRAL-TRIO domain-containing protein n=1 Tax=Mucor mucedo TaxID=29922 RepID=UPI0022206FFB|nr:CRAL-TRIO domain-containing protein [Mucor mucedo]KAI7863256.1 CRAL-TRIO domain-containing protein [Mucor mucedo]